jgi:hypothetical protein
MGRLAVPSPTPAALRATHFGVIDVSGIDTNNWSELSARSAKACFALMRISLRSEDNRVGSTEGPAQKTMLSDPPADAEFRRRRRPRVPARRPTDPVRTATETVRPVVPTTPCAACVAVASGQARTGPGARAGPRCAVGS